MGSLKNNLKDNNTNHIDAFNSLSLKLYNCYKNTHYIIKSSFLSKIYTTTTSTTSDNNNNTTIQYNKCINGQRRCIVLTSCLLYKWFELRCQEWDVYLTGQELLYGYYNDYDNSNNNNNNNSLECSDGSIHNTRNKKK